MVGPLDRRTDDGDLRGVRAQGSLAADMAGSAVAVSPQAAQSVQATENFWRRIADEFGLLSTADAGVRLGAAGARPDATARRWIAQGRLIGVRRRGRRGVLVPGFQFDEARNVYPVVADLLALLPDDTVDTATALVMFLCEPSGWLPDDARPVDLLSSDPDAVLDATRREFDHDVW